jgi:hypothetical protein
MDIDEAISELRRINESVPRPLRLPTERELKRAEAELGVTFPRDYRRFLLQAGDVVYGTKEPSTVLFDGSHTDLVEVAKTAREDLGLPADLVPICEDNGDYYCLTASGEVVFWSHDGQQQEDRWQDLAEWIQHVWIEEK